MYKTTIVIITAQHRWNFLERIYTYYKNQKVQILIADTADSDYSGVLPKNYVYFNFREFDYSKDFIRKIKRALQEVQTEFCIIGADDDFISEDGVHCCEEFLQANLSYCVAQGGYVYFRPKQNKYLPYRMASISIEDDTASARLKNSLEHYVPFFSAVFRTQTLSFIFEHVEENNALTELAITMLALVRGKYKWLPVFFYAKELDYSSGSFYFTTISELVSKSEYAGAYNYFLDILTDAYSDGDPKHDLAQRNCIDSAIQQKYGMNATPYEGSKKLNHLLKLIPRSWKRRITWENKVRILQFLGLMKDVDIDDGVGWWKEALHSQQLKKIEQCYK